MVTAAPSSAGKLTKRTYSLGPVLPHVRTAAEIVGNAFDVATIGGWRASAVDKAGHPAGLALDYMTDRATGDAVAEYLLANAGPLAVKYVIWRQRYREPGGAWQPMEDRGSATANHMDHVHATFKATPGVGSVDPTLLGAVKTKEKWIDPDAGGGVLDALNPFDNWQTDGLSLGVKLLATGLAVVLVVAGASRTVTAGKEAGA
jgi:hypothetical protein